MCRYIGSRRLAAYFKWNTLFLIFGSDSANNILDEVYLLHPKTKQLRHASQD